MDDEIKLTDNISEAHALLALQSKLKKNPQIQAAARSHSILIYVMKTSSLMQLTKAIRALIADHEDSFNDFESDDKINARQKIEALEVKMSFLFVFFSISSFSLYGYMLLTLAN
ncbi:hypothetical protein CsSME_00027719 [Camellia sinensis var. sinensis]